MKISFHAKDEILHFEFLKKRKSFSLKDFSVIIFFDKVFHPLENKESKTQSQERS